MTDKEFNSLHRKINAGSSDGCLELAKKTVKSPEKAVTLLNILIPQFKLNKNYLQKPVRNELIQFCCSILGSLSATALLENICKTDREQIVIFYHVISGLLNENETTLAHKLTPFFIQSIQCIVSKQHDPATWNTFNQNIETCCHSLAIMYSKKESYAEALQFYDAFMSITFQSPKLSAQMNTTAASICNGVFICRKALSQLSELLYDIARLLRYEATDNQTWRKVVGRYWCSLKDDLKKLQHELQDCTVAGILSIKGIAIRESERHELLWWELKAYLQTSLNVNHLVPLDIILKELGNFRTYKGVVSMLESYFHMATTLLGKGETSDSRFDKAVIFAKRSVSTLSSLDTNVPDPENTAIRLQLALSYWFKYWAEWHRLRAKIHTELERLGPLLKSTKTPPPGQEMKGETVTIPVYEYLGIDREQKLLLTLEQSLKTFQSVSQCDYPEVLITPTQWQILSCIRSLACAFDCYGHVNLKAAAWQTCLDYARRFANVEYIVIACSELLKMGFQVPGDLRAECDQFIQQDSFRLSNYVKASYAVAIAWSKFHDEKYDECRTYMKEIQSKNAAINSPLTKSLYVVHTELFLLESHLGVIPVQFRGGNKDDINFHALARVSYEKAYGTAVNYETHAKEIGWDFPGQELQITSLVAQTFIWTLRLALHNGLAFDLKIYSKEFVSYMQKRALTYKTVEGLLYRCQSDLLYENAEDCLVTVTSVLQLLGLRSKISVCHPEQALEVTRSDHSSKDNLVSAETLRASSNVLFSPVATFESSTKSRNAGSKLDPSTLPKASSWQLFPGTTSMGSSPLLKRNEAVTLPAWLSHSRSCRCIDCENLLLWWLAMTLIGIQGRCLSLQGHDAAAVTDFEKSWDLLQRFLQKRCFKLSVTGEGVSRSLCYTQKDSEQDLEQLATRIGDLSLAAIKWQVPIEAWIQPVILCGATNQLESVAHLGATNYPEEARMALLSLKNRLLSQDLPLRLGLESIDLLSRFALQFHLLEGNINNITDQTVPEPTNQLVPTFKLVVSDADEDQLSKMELSGSREIDDVAVERSVTPKAPIPIPKFKAKAAIKRKKAEKRNPLFLDGHESDSDELTKSDNEEIVEFFAKNRLKLKHRPLVIESDDEEKEEEVEEKVAKKSVRPRPTPSKKKVKAAEEEVKPKRGRVTGKTANANATARAKKLAQVEEDEDVVPPTDEEDDNKSILKAVCKAEKATKSGKIKAACPYSYDIREKAKADCDVIDLSNGDDSKKPAAVKSKVVRRNGKKATGLLADKPGTETDEKGSDDDVAVILSSDDEELNAGPRNEDAGTKTKNVTQVKRVQGDANLRRRQIAEDHDATAAGVAEPVEPRKTRKKLAKNPFVL